MRKQKINRMFLLAPLVAALAACTVGPDYVRPKMDTLPESFKEMGDWKPAQPQELTLNGKWWEMFNDAELNALIEQVDVSNQTLAESAATFRKAMAAVQSARASYSPTVSAGGSATRSSSGSSSSSSSSDSGSQVKNTYAASLSASWELDLWGKIQRNVEANEATAQASAADLAATRLSEQALLAQDYLQLRVLDAQQKLYDETVEAYQRSYQLTQNQYAAGVAARSDVIQALAQLKSAQASALDNKVTRSQLEHAIALLVGQPASSFSIKPRPLPFTSPPIPAGVPSMLLQRRPDVSSAERAVAAANANIGVAKAAYFPSLTLSASDGYQTSNGIGNLLSLPSRVWSLGPSLSQTLFDGGALRAATKQAVASYDLASATYKQTVLTAFQEVEDNLVALRVLEQEASVQDEALQASRQAVTLITNQYKAGTVAYSSVVTAQASALSNEISALSILNRRMAASVALIKALGGGWNEQNVTDMHQLSEQAEASKPRQ